MIQWIWLGRPPDIAMTTYMPFDREQPFLLPPDVKDWLRRTISRILSWRRWSGCGWRRFTPTPGQGKPQYHPRLMLALLVYSHANGVFSSRRIERATYRDVGTRLSPPTRIPTTTRSPTFGGPTSRRLKRRFCRFCCWRARWAAAAGRSVDRRDQVDANASKIRTLRYDRARALRVKLAADIAALTAKAEAADAEDMDRGAAGGDRPARGAQGEARRCLRAAGSGSQGRAEAERPQYEARKAAWEAKPGRGGQPPKPPDATPAADGQTNLTDPQIHS